MTTLLLRLQGPMQSWGTTSRFDERDTQLEPSKSGVLGLVCAAMGRDRSQPIDDLARLRMGVRVEREGIPMRDYQTAREILTAAGGKDRAIISRRYYLSDAVFLVGLEGDSGLLKMVHEALKRPVWPLFLGRKSFVPSQPAYLADGIVEKDLETALKNYVLEGFSKLTRRRVLLEHPSEGSVRLDQPVAPFSERQFGPRYVKTVYIDGPDLQETEQCI